MVAAGRAASGRRWRGPRRRAARGRPAGGRPCMNRTPSRVDEERALAADRLGDQRLLAAGPLAEPEHGRVELHELEVGDHRAGAQRRGHAVAGRDRRVGRRGVDLPEAAGGQHDRAGVGRADAVDLALADDVQGHAADPALGVLQQVDDEGVLDDLDARVVLDACSAAISAREISVPVASPPAWAIRSRWWPPSRVSWRSRPSGVAVELGAEGRPARAPGRAPRGPGRAPPPRRRRPAPGDQGVVQVLLRASRPGPAPRRCRPAPTAVEPS